MGDTFARGLGLGPLVYACQIRQDSRSDFRTDRVSVEKGYHYAGVSEAQALAM
jgi:hypothetical protein